MPQLWIGYGEDKRSTTGSLPSGFDILGMWLVNDYLDRTTRVCTTVHSNVDYGLLVPLYENGNFMYLFRPCRPISLVSRRVQMAPIQAIQSAICHCRAYTRSSRRESKFAFLSGSVFCLSFLSTSSQYVYLATSGIFTCVCRIVRVNYTRRKYQQNSREKDQEAQTAHSSH
jgi:hypothetical protein